MKIYFIGIGGIGMSGIAKILLQRGENVSGSDLNENSIIKELRHMGAAIMIGHDASHVKGKECVVYSSSISPNNPELVAARNAGIPVFHRGHMLANCVSSHRAIAVSGSHGKSTTSAMAAQLLVEAKMDPLVVLGAELDAVGGNARSGHGPYAVIEADESDGSFQWIKPFVSIVTNVDQEHLDYFRNMGEIIESYAHFIENVRPDGIRIGCVDDPTVRRIEAIPHPGKTFFYGLSADAHVRAADIRLEKGRSSYQCTILGKNIGTIQLQISGLHNVVNSCAVVALAHVLGIDFKIVRRVLADYRGVRRRFEIREGPSGILVVEDYAHHPTEIEATLQAASCWNERTVRVVFQPHRYSRTKFLLERFQNCFALADEVIVLPIYAASEEPLEGASSELLVRAIRRSGKEKVTLCSPQDALDYLAESASPTDMILFVGAGSVGNCAPQLIERLKERFCANVRGELVSARKSPQGVGDLWRRTMNNKMNGKRNH